MNVELKVLNRPSWGQVILEKVCLCVESLSMCREKSSMFLRVDSRIQRESWGSTELPGKQISECVKSKDTHEKLLG